MPAAALLQLPKVEATCVYEEAPRHVAPHNGVVLRREKGWNGEEQCCQSERSSHTTHLRKSPGAQGAEGRVGCGLRTTHSRRVTDAAEMHT